MKVRLASLALVALCLAVAPPLVGCGGNQGAGAADATRPPPKEVLSMPVRVQTGSHGAFSAALADGLARAGFTVQTDPSAPAEIILVPQVTFSQSTSAFQVTVNGRTKMHVSVSVAVSCGGQMADVLHAEYNDYEDAPPDDEAMATLVLAYAHSGRVAAFAKSRVAAAQAATNEEQEWISVDSGKCANPTTLSACDDVRQYLKNHPQGKHASEATRILGQAGGQLDKLQKDETAWQNAGAADCRKKKSRETCVGIEVYLTKYPNGLHAQEAHSLLGK